jgi:hypothetical protein
MSAFFIRSFSNKITKKSIVRGMVMERVESDVRKNCKTHLQHTDDNDQRIIRE